MATLLIILLFGAIFHFVYENIIAPMFRVETRYELFRLRDEIREDRSVCNPKDDEAFRIVDGQICSAIRRLHTIDLPTHYIATKEYFENETFRKRVDKKISVLKDCANPRIKEARHELTLITLKVIVINSGGWVYVLVPVIAAVLVVSSLTHSLKSLKSSLSERTQRVAFASDHDIEQLKYASVV